MSEGLQPAFDESGFEYAVLHPETGNEVARYDLRQEAEDSIRWYGNTYGPSLQLRVVPAGSGPVCLGISDD